MGLGKSAPGPKSDRLLIEPQDRAFLVGGVTLSTLDEDPFGREPRRPVKITLTDAEQADQPFNLSVEVDRGVATYPYPLPAPGRRVVPGRTRITDGDRTTPTTASPAYVEIAASPSATVRVKSGEAELAQVRWGDVLAQWRERRRPPPASRW